ncbi:MAG: hypothetical protein ACYCW6_27000 [Candidatus Xenobia bacterium]
MASGMPARERFLPVVRQVAESICGPLEARVVEVDFVLEGRNRFLRVTIEEPGGTKLDTCEKVSRSLSRELDRLDCVPGQYFLEVSSPGTQTRPDQGPGEEVVS